MFVHSPPDRPHLIMLFCFLISRNAKCLCHLWTAKRANLGFSLIATVTSLLRLRWGWVEGMAGGGLEDGRMEGWRHSSPHTRPRCERTRQANRTQPGGVQQQGVGDSLRCEKAPTPSWEGGGFSSGQFWSLNFDEEMTTLGWIIVGQFSNADTCYCPHLIWYRFPHNVPFFVSVLLIDNF